MLLERILVGNMLCIANGAERGRGGTIDGSGSVAETASSIQGRPYAWLYREVFGQLLSSGFLAQFRDRKTKQS